MTVQTHWLAFYADRFIKETSQLNPFEVAAYYRLFESYAQTGFLVNNPYMLADIAKLNSAMPEFHALTGARPEPTKWSGFIDATIGGLLSRFFDLAPDGTYHHRGWDAELAKAAAKYEARAKGGRSRWDKETGNETGNHSDTDNHTDTEIEKELTTRARTSEHNAQHIAEHNAQLSPSLLEDKDEDKSTDGGETQTVRPNNGKVSSMARRANDPAVVNLSNELTRMSDGEISFFDRHRARLAETLQAFDEEIIKLAWKAWFPDRLELGDDPNFIAKDFVEAADGLCYTIRRQKQEADDAKVLRDQQAARMQAEAEQERLVRAEQEKLEEEFDPLGLSDCPEPLPSDSLCVSA